MERKRANERAHEKKVHKEKKEVEQQAALRIKEKLKTRKVTTTTTNATKTRLHEPLFMPLMNANKLKWLKKETKTYTLQKYTKDIVCHRRCSGRVLKREGDRPTANSQIKKTQARKIEPNKVLKQTFSSLKYSHTKHTSRTQTNTVTHSAATATTTSGNKNQSNERKMYFNGFFFLSMLTLRTEISVSCWEKHKSFVW